MNKKNQKNFIRFQRALRHGALRVSPKEAGLGRWVWAVLAAVAGFLALRAVFWVGYIGSDDSLYWQEATHWLRQAPYLADNHWGLRHSLVLPIALGRVLLGERQIALVLPVLLASLGCIVVLGVLLRRLGGLAMAFALALVVSNQQFVLQSSIAYIDFIETFFVLLSLTLFLEGMRAEARRPLLWLFLGGVAAGFAMVSRETSVFYLLALFVLFLAGYGGARWTYFVFGLGVVLVVGCEMLSLHAATGDFLYRYHVAAGHDSEIDRWVEQGSGVPAIHPLVDPVLMLLFNHSFGLLFTLGVALAVYGARRPLHPAESGPMIRLLVPVAVIWTLICALWWSQLALVPRYYALPSFLVAILAAIGLARLAQAGRPRVAALICAGMVAVNVAALFVGNDNFMFGEQALAALAQRQGEVIHTDKQTYRRAEMILHWNGEDERVTDAPAGSGQLFYFNPPRLPQGVQPGAAWVEVARPAVPPTRVQRVAQMLQPLGIVPAGLIARLQGHSGAVLYRLP